MDEQKQEEQPAEASTRLSPPEERHQAEHERVREPSHYQTVMLFADQLGETEEGPRKQLVRLVQALGRTQTRTLLENPLRIEEGSGLMPDGSRRRTPGGVFFYLAYTISRPKEGKKLSRSVQRPPGAEVGTAVVGGG